MRHCSCQSRVNQRQLQSSSSEQNPDLVPDPDQPETDSDLEADPNPDQDSTLPHPTRINPTHLKPRSTGITRPRGISQTQIETKTQAGVDKEEPLWNPYLLTWYICSVQMVNSSVRA